MNLERISEIDDGCKQTPSGGYINYYDGNWKMVHALEIAELCRLARLGLRVEEAPSKEIIAGMFKLNSRITVSVPDEWIGKRVALVVLEESK